MRGGVFLFVVVLGLVVVVVFAVVVVLEHGDAFGGGDLVVAYKLAVVEGDQRQDLVHLLAAVVRIHVVRRYLVLLLVVADYPVAPRRQ
jgi:hypothetical protein